MRHDEDRLQIACMKWLKYQYPSLLAFHVPNGGKRNPREGKKFKAMGVMAGVADILILQSKGIEPIIYHGLAIELKAGKNIQQESQEMFQKKVMEAGWQYSICYDIDQFMNVVNNYLK